jgi:outer membrane receptor protein involved in Fe transport
MIRYVLNTLGSFRSALVVGVGLPFLAAASASAQAPAPEATTERVIVTGSYIPTAETESALPVTVYTAEVLQKAGSNTPVEGLRQLPSFVGNAVTENDSNGGNGQATINLRAVGSENTLVLINGRRATLGRGANGLGADINAISIAATSRTEVLKDGASAIYGSDAVAGVVNFILLNGPGEKPYEGAELFTLYGNTTDTDAHVRQVFVRGGVTGLDGKVSIAASGEYYSRANLFSRDRSISTTGDLSNDATGLQQGGINNNSPTFPGRIAFRSDPDTVLQFVLSNQGTVSPIGLASYRPFDVNPGTDPSRFNFRDFSPAIPAVEKAMYYVTGRYKVFGEGLQLYGDVMYAKTKQDNGLAGSPFSSSQLQTSDGALAGGQIARISQFNPFPTVTDPETGGLISGVTQFRYRTHRELGNRRNFVDADYYRYVAGVNGDFNFKDNGFISHFGYDSGFVYERYSSLTTDTGDADARPLADEIVAGNFNPYIGEQAPLVGTALIYNNDNPNAPNYRNGVSIGTAPYDNIAAAQRAAFLGHSLFNERSWGVDAKINAHLFPNLWNGGIDFAMGYEHREDATHSTPDPVEAQGFQLGFNAAPNTKYLQEVDSFFVEATIPIVTSTMNVPFVRSLEISAAWRYEKFKDFDQFKIGNTGNDPLGLGPAITSTSFDNSNPDEDFGGTPRLTLRYQPIADLTLRASWGQSFRSPTPDTLFNPGAQNFPVLFDPLQGNTLQPPDGTQQTGNAQVQPEKTDAYSAGVVWTPKFVPGFTMTMDVYQLFTRDLILSAANFAQVMLTANALSGDTLFVDPDGCIGLGGGPALGITRTSFQGDVDCIDSHAVNAGKRLVEGLDITVVYEIPTERFGKFTLSGAWNHFFIWKAEPFDGQGTHNFLGDYNNGTFPLAPGGVPFNKAFVRSEWEWKGFDLVLTGNYVGDYEDDPSFILDNTITNPGSGNPEFAFHRRVSDYETLDMQLSYEFKKPATEPAPVYAKDSKDGKNVMAQTDASSSSIWQRMLWNTKLTVGVNNAFDRNPPIVLGAFNDNYDTSNYSIRNRYWYVSMSKKF